MTDWEPVVIAGFGAAALQIDPALSTSTMLALVLKGFIGGAVGAYFGNHVHAYRAKKKANGHG